MDTSECFPIVLRDFPEVVTPMNHCMKTWYRCPLTSIYFCPALIPRSDLFMKEHNKNGPKLQPNVKEMSHVVHHYQEEEQIHPSETPLPLLRISNISKNLLAKLLIVLSALPHRMSRPNTALPVLVAQPRNALHLNLNAKKISKLVNIRTETLLRTGVTESGRDLSADRTNCPKGSRSSKVCEGCHWAAETVDELQGIDMIDLLLKPGDFLGDGSAQEVGA